MRPLPPTGTVIVGSIDAIIGRPFSISARTSGLLSEASWASLVRQTSATQIRLASSGDV